MFNLVWDCGSPAVGVNSRAGGKGRQAGMHGRAGQGSEVNFGVSFFLAGQVD